MNSIETCPTCNGQGRLVRELDTGHETVCKRCKGTGTVSIPEKGISELMQRSDTDE